MFLKWEYTQPKKNLIKEIINHPEKICRPGIAGRTRKINKLYQKINNEIFYTFLDYFYSNIDCIVRRNKNTSQS